ncbi:MAG TPA: ISAzo13 family transposase, partial [Chloroflexota bacterium]|nr:ISAzo13 family transposase [Chloroflexota bacterium]
MQDATIMATLREKFIELSDDLDERGRRRWAAVEARALGRGGITAVAHATGMSDRTIRTGLAELDVPDPLSADRQRRRGAGRKPHSLTQPGLVEALDRMIDPSSRGSPTNPLRWTIKSTRRLASELRDQGYQVSATSIRRLLARMGYSLQANRKTREGREHPDRDGQFRHIEQRVRSCKRRREPAISVDTKKKEVLGNLKNPGAAYRPRGKPEEVKTHDFPDPKLGKAIPYGVYDIQENQAGVSVGISHDTAEFAVGAIRRWWEKLGRDRYGRARRLLVTADSGGSNSARNRLWKVELQRLADETGLVIEVCHYPPGTSKWNKIEHRLFCHITRNWRGRPLETLEVVVQSINATTTETGLEVHAWLDQGTYERGRKVSDQELAECHIKRHAFHGEWNYE